MIYENGAFGGRVLEVWWCEATIILLVAFHVKLYILWRVFFFKSNILGTFSNFLTSWNLCSFQTWYWHCEKSFSVQNRKWKYMKALKFAFNRNKVCIKISLKKHLEKRCIECMDFAGVNRRLKLRPKAGAFFPSVFASLAEAFRQKVWQKVWSLIFEIFKKKKIISF